MNRHSTGRRGRSADRAAASRYMRLRTAGVPSMLTPRAAWYLSGGVMGRQDQDARATVPTASVAKHVPDCERFLPDYQEEYAA